MHIELSSVWFIDTILYDWEEQKNQMKSAKRKMEQHNDGNNRQKINQQREYNKSIL